ncbi:hypothetical protein ACH5RR_005511 [Cinchona calisaya]|uniref:Uncharacterized protein n=1 Tax=Cinchona calisaya TaxID=153742 RepID=A0ABD3ALD7_9GENT
MHAGLRRSGKSCRLRWMNYLRPNLKHGHITEEEEHLIIQLHKQWGNRWSRIARSLPGRTDNEIKNYWRCHLRKKALIVEQEQSSNIQSVIVPMTEDSEQNTSCSNRNGECVSQKDNNLRTCAEFSGGVEELSLSSFGLTYSPFETRLTADWTSNWSEMQNYDDDKYSYCSPEWIISSGYNETSSWDCSLSIWDMD